MAPIRDRKPRTSSRIPDMICDRGKYSRSKMYHKRGLWVIKAKNAGVFLRHNLKSSPRKPQEKLPKFYPADGVKKIHPQSTQAQAHRAKVSIEVRNVDNLN